MFWKKRIEKENEALRRYLVQLAAERAKIRDMVARTSAGLPGMPASSGGEDPLERLQRLTVQRENLELQVRIARAETEIEAESQWLEQEIARLEQQLQEPLSLQLLAPTAGQQVDRGVTLNIQWSSTGPIGDRLRIVLLKRGILLQSISYGALNTGSFSWLVPTKNELPAGDDYEVAIQDPTSGLSATNRVKIC